MPNMTSIETPTPNTLDPRQELLDHTAETLFGDTRFRPTPQAMASLIERGAVEDTIIQAAESRGMQLPQMELTLAELDASLPYTQAASDQLAHRGGR